jgi:hypothetical protein
MTTVNGVVIAYVAVLATANRSRHVPRPPQGSRLGKRFGVNASHGAGAARLGLAR